MMGSDFMIGWGYWSLWHWIFFAVVAVLILYPVGRILERIGFSPFWSVLALIPLANFIGLWLLAISPWPRDRGSLDRDPDRPRHGFRRPNR